MDHKEGYSRAYNGFSGCDIYLTKPREGVRLQREAKVGPPEKHWPIRGLSFSIERMYRSGPWVCSGMILQLSDQTPTIPFESGIYDVCLEAQNGEGARVRQTIADCYLTPRNRDEDTAEFNLSFQYGNLLPWKTIS